MAKEGQTRELSGTSHGWTSDIPGTIMVGAIAKFLELSDILAEVVLQLGVDSDVWNLSASGQQSAKSTYMGRWAASLTQ